MQSDEKSLITRQTDGAMVSALAGSSSRTSTLSVPSSSDIVYKTAVVHALTAHPAEALAALEKALDMGFRAWEARVDEDLASLRKNERFVSLTSRKEAS